MWPVLGSLLGGAMSFFGQQDTNQQNAANVAATNATNVELQQQNQQFEANMSNTAYQRASTDMTKAGLNPMMMFGSGGPAGTPNVAPAHVQPVGPQASPMSTVAGSIRDTVNSAINSEQMDKMTEEIANLHTQNALIQAQTDAAEAHSRVGNLTAQTIAAALPVTFNAAKTASNQMAIPDWARKPADVGAFMGDKIGHTLAPIGDILGFGNSAVNLTRTARWLSEFGG